MPHATVNLDVAADFEHGLLVDTAAVCVGDTPLRRNDLGYLAPGASQLVLTNPTDDTARVLLLGGVPFDEPILMWWNFVGREHDEIVAFREAWQAESDQFGAVEGYRGPVARIPAPPLPHLRLVPRRR